MTRVDPHRNGDPDILDLIRQKIGSGFLPRQRPVRIYAGYGVDATCDACDRPIDRTQVEYELTDPATEHTCRLHLHCLYYWETERRTARSLITDRDTTRRPAMLKDFKEFVMRGNVLELAIGLVMGAAFGKIVASFVTDILMPPIGLALGGVDFTNLFLSVGGQAYPTLAAARAAGAPTLNYGVFLQTVLDFLIIALAIFVLIRVIASWRRPAPAAPTTRPCVYCLSSVPLKATRCAHCTSELKPA